MNMILKSTARWKRVLLVMLVSAAFVAAALLITPVPRALSLQRRIHAGMTDTQVADVLGEPVGTPDWVKDVRYNSKRVQWIHIWSGRSGTIRVLFDVEQVILSTKYEKTPEGQITRHHTYTWVNKVLGSDYHPPYWPHYPRPIETLVDWWFTADLQQGFQRHP
jgi:hypothetical protein